MVPLMMAYLALMAASTAASAQAQHKTNKARSKVFAEERERRTKQQKESEATAKATADSYAQVRGKEDARAAELARDSASVAPPTTTDAGTRYLDVGAPVQSTQTIKAMDDARALAHTKSTSRNAARGALGAFGDVMLGTGLQADRNAQDIQQGANFTQGWQRDVMPALINRANMAGRDWATGADVAKLAATIMAPYAMGASAGANTTQGVLQQMAGTPKEFVGAFPQMGAGMPFSAAGAGVGAGAGAASSLVEQVPQKFGPYSEFFDPSQWMQQRKPFPWSLLPTTPVDPRPFGGVVGMH